MVQRYFIYVKKKKKSVSFEDTTLYYGFFHFIFLTSNTDFFSDFERNFYTDNITEEQKMLMRLGIVDQTKVQKEINLEELKNLTDKEKYSIKE
jgi:hypothetical protein